MLAAAMAALGNHDRQERPFGLQMHVDRQPPGQRQLKHPEAEEVDDRRRHACRPRR